MIRFFLAVLLLISYGTYAQDCSPSLNEIYDFEVGSIFQYRNVNTASNGGNQRYYNVVERYTVIDKWIINDTIGYIRDGVRQTYTEYDFNYEPIIKQTSDFCDTVIVIDSALHPMNACDAQMVYLGLENDFYSYVIVGDEEGVPMKRIGGYINGQNNLFKRNSNDSLIEVTGFEFEQIYLQGIGLKSHSEIIFEGSQEIFLEGYVFNGDTVGLIWNDSDFIASGNDFTLDQTFKFFPTFLTDDLINFYFGKDYKDLKIYSIEGKIQEFHFINGNQIRLLDPVQGLYFVKLIFDDFSLIQRFVIP